MVPLHFKFVILIKSCLNSAVEQSGEVKARRMMGYTRKQPRTEIASAPTLLLEAPTPAPIPEPVSGIREVILTRFFKSNEAVRAI